MNKREYMLGIKDAIPVGLGYFAVSISLGIIASNIGLNLFETFLLSFLNNASAGEYAGLQAIKEHSTLISLAIVIIITNSRYLLMSFSLSQKLDNKVPFWQRALIAYSIVDELYALACSKEKLNPFYYFGMMSISIPCWALGTIAGLLLGNLLPVNIVSALSIALYAMFIAIVVPPCKKEKGVFFAVLISFVSSYLFNIIFPSLSSGIKVIILTVIIATIISLIFPKGDQHEL